LRLLGAGLRVVGIEAALLDPAYQGVEVLAEVNTTGRARMR